MQLGVQGVAEVCQSPPTRVLTPGREPLQRVSQFLARCTTLPMELAPAVSPPATLQAQKINAGCASRLTWTEGDDPGFGCRSCQPKLSKALSSRLVKAFGVALILERAHKIVCVPNQARLALAARFDHLVKPQVERIVQGSYWIPGSWMCRGHPTQWLSFFPPRSPSFSMAFNREVCFSDHDGA